MNIGAALSVKKLQAIDTHSQSSHRQDMKIQDNDEINCEQEDIKLPNVANQNENENQKTDLDS